MQTHFINLHLKAIFTSYEILLFLVMNYNKCVPDICFLMLHNAEVFAHLHLCYLHQLHGQSTWIQLNLSQQMQQSSKESIVTAK